MTRIVTAEDYRRSQWADLDNERPADKSALRVLLRKDKITSAEFAACDRLWKDLARASGQGGGQGVFVDCGVTDKGAQIIDQGAALRRAGEAMGFVLRHLRTDAQRAIFARVFDMGPVTRTDYVSVLRDCRCHHDTLAKGVARAGSLLVIFYARLDRKPLDGGCEFRQGNL